MMFVIEMVMLAVVVVAIVLIVEQLRDWMS